MKFTSRLAIQFTFEQNTEYVLVDLQVSKYCFQKSHS